MFNNWRRALFFNVIDSVFVLLTLLLFPSFKKLTSARPREWEHFSGTKPVSQHFYIFTVNKLYSLNIYVCNNIKSNACKPFNDDASYFMSFQGLVGKLRYVLKSKKMYCMLVGNRIKIFVWMNLWILIFNFRKPNARFLRHDARNNILCLLKTGRFLSLTKSRIPSSK